MTLPDTHTAKSFVGKHVADDAGAELGTCVDAYADDATEIPEWLVVDLTGAGRVLVPIGGAAAHGDTVRMAFSRASITSAPQLGTGGSVSVAEEDTLYRHYGVPVSTAASETLLPRDGAAGPTSPLGAQPPTTRMTGPTTTRVTSADLRPGRGSRRRPDSSTSDASERRMAAWRTVEPQVRSYGPAVLGGVAAAALAALGVRRLRRAPEPAPPARFLDVATERLSDAGWATTRGAMNTAALGVMAAQAVARPVGQLTTQAVGQVRPLTEQAVSRAGYAGGLIVGDGRRVARRGTDSVSRLGAVATTRAAHLSAAGRSSLTRTVGGAGSALTGTRGALDAARRSGRTSRRRLSPTAALRRVGEPLVQQARTAEDAVERAGNKAMRRFWLVVGLGSGYVLGARAGHERYEQIRDAGASVLARPEVQALRARAGEMTEEFGKGSSIDVTDRARASAPGPGHGTPAPRL